MFTKMLNKFGEMLNNLFTRVGNHDTEIAALKAEVAALKATVALLTATPATTAVSVVEPAPVVKAVPVEPTEPAPALPVEVTTATSDVLEMELVMPSWVEDDPDLEDMWSVAVEAGGELTELKWSTRWQDLVVTMIVNKRHPAFMDQVAAMTADERRRWATVASQKGDTSMGLPGYHSIPEALYGNGDRSNVSNAYKALWATPEFIHQQYASIDVLKYMCRSARDFGLSWGKFTANDAAEEFVKTEYTMDVDDGELPWEETPVHTDADVPAEPAAPVDLFGEWAGAVSTEETKTESKSTNMDEDEDDGETDGPTNMDEDEGEDEGESATPTNMDEPKSESKPTNMDEDDEDEPAEEKPAVEEKSAEKKPELVAPNPVEYDWLKVPKGVSTKGNLLYLQNAGGRKTWTKTWAKHYVPVKTENKVYECLSVQHAEYVRELLYWGFDAQAEIACDREMVGCDSEGRPLISNAKHWCTLLKAFEEAHPETAVNRKQRYEHFEFEAWCAVAADSRNTKFRSELQATGDAHLVSWCGPNSKSWSTPKWCLTLEYLRTTLFRKHAK